MTQPSPGQGTQAKDAIAPGALISLLLLLAINLFNYIDRYVLASVLPILKYDPEMFARNDPLLRTKLGALVPAFMFSYMLLSPVFGYFGDRLSRWWLIGGAVIFWSLACGASGLAVGFWLLLATRCLVGVGEAAYGPVAPALLSDMYPERRRGYIMAWFYCAIPVGSALGFGLGGFIAELEFGGKELGWRGPFLVLAVPGILLGLVCFFMTDTTRKPRDTAKPAVSYWSVVRMLTRIKSFRLNCIAQTAATFAIGGIAVWMPDYIFELETRFQVNQASLELLAGPPVKDGHPEIPEGVRAKLGDELAGVQGEIDGKTLAGHVDTALTDTEQELYAERIYSELKTPDSLSLTQINLIFGGIVVVSGLGATLGGGLLADRLRSRIPGSYFLVSGGGALLGLPLFLAMLYTPFPTAWVFIFLAVFCLFLNTGPANTILANVVPGMTRATAFAVNILIIHALGDAISPFIIGGIADQSSLRTGFLVVSVMIAVSGVVWLMGMPHLRKDTDEAEMKIRNHESHESHE